MRRTLLLCSTLLLPLAGLAPGTGSTAHAYSSGITSNAFTPETGCNKCHSGGSVVPELTLSGPLSVAPGGTLEVSASVTGSGSQTNAGTNLSGSIGTLSSPSDSNLQLKTNSVTGLAEITHKSRFTGPIEFTARWKAPDGFTTATLTLWGNAVNGNGGNTGDKAASRLLEITACTTDADGDGAYALSCIGGTDCSDDNAGVQPDVEETCDGLDNNCNGETDEGVLTLYFTDQDRDGFGDSSSFTSSCSPPPDTATQGGDCDDTNSDANPGETESTEQCEDGIDQDCTGGDRSCDTADSDGDGFSLADGDCNDGADDIYPGAAETPYDGVDQDCDTSDLADVDEDGFDGGSGDDCDDDNAAIYPGALELPDGLDNDCDGFQDEGTENTDDDGDGASESQGDCDDDNASIHEGATEVCDDGTDQDCDGSDVPCPSPTMPPGDSDEEDDDADAGGCGCRSTDLPSRGLPLGSLLLLGTLVGGRRRRR